MNIKIEEQASNLLTILLNTKKLGINDALIYKMDNMQLLALCEAYHAQALLSQCDPVAKKSRDQLFLEEQDTLRISKSDRKSVV